MTLRYTYTLFAPAYDALVAPFTARARRDSLLRLRVSPCAEVLLVGIGSGLDLPLLPRGPRYTGLDLTSAMLARAQRTHIPIMRCSARACSVATLFWQVEFSISPDNVSRW